MRAILRPLLLSLVLFACAAACVKLPRRGAPSGDRVPTAQATNNPAPPVSINRASQAEIERLPGVGPVLAARIVEHRERHGPFLRVEHLLVVRGMSDRRFRELRALVTAE